MFPVTVCFLGRRLLVHQKTMTGLPLHLCISLALKISNHIHTNIVDLDLLFNQVITVTTNLMSALDIFWFWGRNSESRKLTVIQSQ